MSNLRGQRFFCIILYFPTAVTLIFYQKFTSQFSNFLSTTLQSNFVGKKSEKFGQFWSNSKFTFSRQTFCKNPPTFHFQPKIHFKICKFFIHDITIKFFVKKSEKFGQIPNSRSPVKLSPKSFINSHFSLKINSQIFYSTPAKFFFFKNQKKNSNSKFPAKKSPQFPAYRLTI